MITDDTKNNLPYEAAMHGVQTAIAHAMNQNDRLTEPKHLRVGIDSCQITDEALARLLIKKGIITEAEYLEEVRICANRELDRWEAKNPGINFR